MAVTFTQMKYENKFKLKQKKKEKTLYVTQFVMIIVPKSKSAFNV